MYTKVIGEQQVQILSPNFSISPSNEDYVLNISANGRDFSPLFAVSAGVTRLVSNVAPGSYYKLVGNQSEVVINWQRMCATEGGADSSELTPIDYFPLAADPGTVIAYSGSSSAAGIYQFDGTDWVAAGGSADLDGYWTSAQTKDYVDTAVSGIDLSNYYTKAETDSAITLVEDHLFDVEEVTSSALTELHDAVLELSANTPDLSAYWTSAETEEAIAEAISGITPSDPTILKGVQEFSSAATYGDVQSKYTVSPGLPDGVTFVTGNTYGDNLDQFGGTLSIPVGFAAGTTEDNPIYLMSLVSGYDGAVGRLFAYENEWKPGGVILILRNEEDNVDLQISMGQGSEEAGTYVFGIDSGVNDITANYLYTETADTNFVVEFYASYNWGEDQPYPDPTFDVPESSTDYGVYVKTENGWVEVGAGGGSASGETVVELTQAQYDALSGYAENTTYIITDAQAINMENYALSGYVESALTSKADAASVTAGDPWNPQIPVWNEQGVITGTSNYAMISTDCYMNGNYAAQFYGTGYYSINYYAPTTYGAAGAPLLANGESNAPVWADYKFQFITQSAYDQLATKDATTIYFIIG